MGGGIVIYELRDQLSDRARMLSTEKVAPKNAGHLLDFCAGNYARTAPLLPPFLRLSVCSRRETPLKYFRPDTLLLDMKPIIISGDFSTTNLQHLIDRQFLNKICSNYLIFFNVLFVIYFDSFSNFFRFIFLIESRS